MSITIVGDSLLFEGEHCATLRKIQPTLKDRFLEAMQVGTLPIKESNDVRTELQEILSEGEVENFMTACQHLGIGFIEK